MHKQRRNIRYDYPSTIEYRLEHAEPTDPHKAVTVNISDSGLGAYFFAHHHQGQVIIIQSRLPIPARIAMVRWIKKENDGLYFAGLSFER